MSTTDTRPAPQIQSCGCWWEGNTRTVTCSAHGPNRRRRINRR
jgi:hypothetical protein